MNLQHALEGSSIDHAVSFSDLCAKDEVRDLILKKCNAVGQREGFKAAEVLCGVVLTSEEWTPESGLVTPAQKIQRGKIAQVFADGIKVCFFLCCLSMNGSADCFIND